MAAAVHSLAAAQAVQQSVRKSDGWANLATGLGDALRDKRLSSAFTTSTLSSDQCEDLYRGDDLAARVVDLLAADMTREWCDVLVEGDKETAEKVQKDLDERLRAQEKCRLALTWARLFGGSVLLIGKLDGSEDLSAPLDEAKLDSLDYLNVFDAREAIGVAWYADLQADRFGEVAIYRIQPLTLNVSSTMELQLRQQERKGVYQQLPIMGLGADTQLLTIRYAHESRVLRFEGTKLSRRLERSQFGWGDSVLQRYADEIRDFQASFDSSSVLVQDFSQAVFKMQGLAEAISSGQEGLIKSRLTAMDLSRSVVRATVIDAGTGGAGGEDFERKSTPLAGLPDLLDKFMLKLSAATGYPMTLLFGMSPAGMNATGESDIRLYYDKVKDQQTRQLLPPLRRLVQLLFRCKRGPTQGAEPKRWSIAFRSLWQLDDVQRATARKTQAEADVAYVNAGVLTPEEVASSRFGGDDYSFETQLVEADPVKRAMQAQELAEEQQGPAAEGTGDGEGTGTGEATGSSGA